MVKIIIKGMLIGALVSFIWDIVGGVLADHYQIGTLPEEKATQVLARLQEFSPQPGDAYIVPSLDNITEQLTESDKAPLVVLMLRPQVNITVGMLSMLLSYFLPAAFLTLVLCLATKHSLPLRRQHVVIGAVLGILTASVGLSYVIGLGFPPKLIAIEILNEGIHFALMGLAIHPFVRHQAI